VNDRWAAHASRWGAGALARTWRLQVAGEEHVTALSRRGEPFVFALWHDSLLAPLWHRRGQGITLLVSGSRDASSLAVAARSWGYHVVLGSSTQGAVSGFRGLVRALAAHGVGAVTPDGPRGPARQVKAGVLRAAHLARAAVVPVGMAASREWRLGSWDRFRIPQPLAHVRIVYGEPTLFGPDDATELAALIDRVEGMARCLS
jgi:lysophospholipid acyltransferase (LPLAT)-like uncharacterized protein